MTLSRLDLVPACPAVCSDAAVTLDLLVRITPPPAGTGSRPALNLGLVLDRSGSMAGANKIGYARQAAALAVQQLRPTDRVSVVVFDHYVDTLLPGTPAADPARVLALLGLVRPRGNTALHAGWQAGVTQVLSGLLPGGINRVLLLSDGLANTGVVNPETIAHDVAGAARAGVSTTALGLGDDYDENLLEAVARAGDGRYWYVDSPDRLPAIFQEELLGLAATLGTGVTLAVQPGDGVQVQVLNGLDATLEGGWSLPNLVAGCPVEVVVRLTVPPTTGEVDLARVTVSWDDVREPGRRTAAVPLRLPAVPRAAWDKLPEDPGVRELAVLLTVAGLKRQAGTALDTGDVAAGTAFLAEAGQVLSYIPGSEAVRQEEDWLRQLRADLASGATDRARKTAKYQSHQRSLTCFWSPPGAAETCDPQ